LVDDFLKQHTTHFQKSWVIGDRKSDKQFADNLGITFLQISENHDWGFVAQTILSEMGSSKKNKNGEI